MKTTNYGCTSKFTLLRTNVNHPQMPHVDYPWKYLNQSSRGKSDGLFIKPAIIIWPLTSEGMMINVWLDNMDLKGNVKTKEYDDIKYLLPYKLFIEYGKFAIIDGDIIHAGGITPSGDRGHAYIGTVEAVEGASNTIVNKYGVEYSTYCTVPYSDYYRYHFNNDNIMLKEKEHDNK